MTPPFSTDLNSLPLLADPRSDQTVIGHSQVPGSSIEITDQLRNAVNQFVNKGGQGEKLEIIRSSDVGKYFYRGILSDGAIHFGDYLSSLSVREASLRDQFVVKGLDKTGKYEIECNEESSLRPRVKHTADQMLRMKNLDLDAKKQCDSTTNPKEITAWRARFVIAALFGFEEIRSNYKPVAWEKSLAQSLRLAMGIDRPPNPFDPDPGRRLPLDEYGF